MAFLFMTRDNDMKIGKSLKNYLIKLFLIIGIGGGLLNSAYSDDPAGVNTITPLEKLPDIYNKYVQMYPKCIAELQQLAYVKLSYWGFDNQEHTGVLIVNKELAKDVLDIFMELRDHKFPIERMEPVSAFDNSDDASMEANNTSAFNCREVTGQPGILSQHSYGRAIDINPKINPYVKKGLVSPDSGREHVDRSQDEPGKITRESLVYRLFTQRGWDWGGNWNDLQDYQHVEKRANGEKRNPNGYLSR